MRDHRNIALILSANDLEAKRIAAIGKSTGAQVIDIGAAWGEWLELSEFDRIWAELDAPADMVIFVECANPKLSEHVRGMGIETIEIDHHVYIDAGMTLDARNHLTSLEQVIAELNPTAEQLKKVDLDDEYLSLINANDRGYWHELLRVQCRRQLINLESLLRIRADDIAAQRQHQITTDDCIKVIEKSANWLLENPKTIRLLREPGNHGRLLVLHSPDADRTGTVLDHELLAHDGCYLNETRSRFNAAEGEAREINPGTTPIPEVDYLRILMHSTKVIAEGATDTREMGPELFYSTSGHGSSVIDEVIQREADPVSRRYECLSMYAGGAGRSRFLGASPNNDLPEALIELSELGDELLRESQPELIPLRRWRARFLQMLDYTEAADVTSPAISDAFSDEMDCGLKDELTLLGRMVQADVVQRPAETTRQDLVSKDQDSDANYFMQYLSGYIAAGQSRGDDENLADTPWDTTIEQRDPARPAIPSEPGTKLDSGSLVFRSYTKKPKTLDSISFTVTSDISQETDSTSGVGPVDVKDANIHFLFDNLMMTDFSIGEEADLELLSKLENSERISLLDQVFETTANSDARCLADLLYVLDPIRRVYPDFKNSADAKYVMARCSEDEILHEHASRVIGLGGKATGWYRRLLKQLVAPFWAESDADGGPDLLDKFRLLHDSRSRMIVSAIPLGSLPSTKAGKQKLREIRQRMVHLDEWGSGSPYDAAFSQAELEQASYKRFEGFGSFYTFTDHSVCLLGYGRFPAEFGLRHMDRMYRRMFMLVLSYGCILSKLSKELAALETNENANRVKALSGLKKRYIRFANGLWFERVTSEFQGHEIFRIMVEQSQIKLDYDELNAEIERSDLLAKEQAASRFTRVVTFIASIIALSNIAVATIDSGFGFPLFSHKSVTASAIGIVAIFVLSAVIARIADHVRQERRWVRPILKLLGRA